VIYFGYLSCPKYSIVEGGMNTITVKRAFQYRLYPTKQWSVTFSCEVEIEPAPLQDKPAVGIDMGLEYYASFQRDHNAALNILHRAGLARAVA
jgi:transposase